MTDQATTEAKSAEDKAADLASRTVRFDPPLPLATVAQQLYMLALRVSFRQDLGVDEWAENAQVMAQKLAARMGDMGAAAPPNVPQPAGTLPPQAPAPNYVGPSFTTTPGAARPAGKSQFGPAFDGWDEASLRRILVGAQALVIGRENGADESQQRELWGEIEAGIMDLQIAHQSSRG